MLLCSHLLMTAQGADSWPGVQMVGAYPFERPEDKNDTQKLQKMIQVTTPTP